MLAIFLACVDIGRGASGIHKEGSFAVIYFVGVGWSWSLFNTGTLGIPGT